MSIIEKRFSSSEDEGHMILMRLRVVGFVMKSIIETNSHKGEAQASIKDFGLPNSFAIKLEGPFTNRVVTIWYRALKLLLGSMDYGYEIHLWSA
ncbi:hypothetical protein JHK82_025115 [Glycine max]|nr:hypothetical protein JHK82_025115 [Glycine max]